MAPTDGSAGPPRFGGYTKRMHRLFVAIRPPEPVRATLLDLMEGVEGARWQHEDQLHLTLLFIGEVERPLAEDIAAALGTVRHPRFALSLNGLGTFERRRQPVTLWAGVTPHDELKPLQKKVAEACARAGADPDRRAYAPHITLARLGRSTGSIRPLIESAGGLTSEAFAVDEFRLYESDLTPQGAIHTVVERYPLS